MDRYNKHLQHGRHDISTKTAEIKEHWSKWITYLANID